MELVQPFSIDVKQQNRIGISLFVVKTLELGHVDGIIRFLVSKNRTSLSVNCSYVDGLLHALESHPKQEQSRYLEGYGQVYEDSSQRCDLGLVLFLY